jgi:hypothetical protein
VILSEGEYTKADGMIAHLHTDRATAGGMIVCFFTDPAFGIGGSHFGSIDLPLNTVAAAAASPS